MAENQKSEWDERELGALWKKQSANGRKYLSGKLKVGGKDMNVVCFPNQNKKADNHPDFRLYTSKEYEANAQTDADASQTDTAPSQEVDTDAEDIL